jgi:hypothetical protein
MNSIEWQLVASGFLNALLADMVSVTSKDARILLLNDGAFIGKIQRASYDSMGWVPPRNSIVALERFIDSQHINPNIVTVVPMVTGVSVDSGIITCDDPGDGYETYLYSWNYVEFTEIGDLLSNSDPGPGVYVLVNEHVIDGNIGLPSMYVTIT